MNSFPDIKLIHKQLIMRFDQYIDKYNRGDKFTIADQRIQFDLDFLSHFWMCQHDKYLMSYINYTNRIELMDITKGLKALGIIKSDNIKLETVCREFGIEIKAHDAMSDIEATRELYYFFQKHLCWVGMDSGKEF